MFRCFDGSVFGQVIRVKPSDNRALPEFAATCPIPSAHAQNESIGHSHAVDGDLITAIIQQSDGALREVIHLHGPAILGSAVYTLGDAHLAEDVMQSVFIGLWQTPAKFDPRRGSLRSFLLAQCHGKCVDLIRSRNARAARETKVARMTVASAPPIDHSVMLEVATQKVRRALDGLPQAEREVIVLAFYGGHTYRRVAVLLGLPEGTVKARIRSALSHLHDTLCREEGVGRPLPSASGFSQRCSNDLRQDRLSGRIGAGLLHEEFDGGAVDRD